MTFACARDAPGSAKPLAACAAFLESSEKPNFSRKSNAASANRKPVFDFRGVCNYSVFTIYCRGALLQNLKAPVPRPVVWLGNSKKNIWDFPKGAQKLLGDELQLIQFGGMPKDAKPFKGVGSGVLEIALRYASDAYRVVVAVQIGKRIYVLHAFQKKSKRGIETAKRDADLIKKRFAEARELAHEHEKAKTN